MEIQFLGGAGEVGRSSILIDGKKKILLDNGIKIDHIAEYPIRTPMVDALILSHAHLDHSGFSPALYFTSNSPVAFGTKPTLELGEMLIEDSMKIARKEKLVQRFFKKQLSMFEKHYVPLAYGKQINFAEYNISLHDAGHITGSAISAIEDQHSGRRIVYTGDFKSSPQLLHNGAETVKGDILITESTYANKEHSDREEITKRLVEEIKDTIDNDGTALLPVFAIGRGQEVLALLEKNGLTDRAFLDGMVVRATETVLQHKSFISNPKLLESGMSHACIVRDRRERADALQPGNIILTTAGMLNGGPILDYIKKADANSKIFLTGYQVEGTNGRKILEGRPLTIDNRKYRPKMPVSLYDMSAHAGNSDLLSYIKESGAEKIICVHGEHENSLRFVEKLKEEGFDASAPRVGESLEVDL